MAPAPIASRIVDAPAGPARLLQLPTSARRIVSFRGSFRTGPDFSSNDDLTQALLTDVLDKGTRHRDRFAIAELLDGRGARLSFYSDGLFMGFSGRALRDDLPFVFDLLAEQLREPALDADEIAKAVARAVAGVQQARESTASCASGALARRLYSREHPNYVHHPDDEIAGLQALTPEVVRAYHAAHIGSDNLLVAVVGDVDPDATAAAVGRAFEGFAPTGHRAVFGAFAQPEPPGRVHLEMADRDNLDVRMGHAVALRRDDPDYLPLYAAVHALGGNFSSRLMQTVRDEQGLTYGIGAALSGLSVEHEGHVRVSISLSAQNLERGIEAARKQVQGFVDGRLAEEELDRTRTTLAGQHVVSLATTSGMAARLLVNAERGFPVSYLDAYPELVRAVTVEQVHEAVARHLRPADLHTVVAGTRPKLAAIE
jgi:predicted Zn-dependent peptidase